jgi:NADPH-dependent 2,4-dienoyl-CoA reductase/sulfur reductase-like enzyme
VDGECDFLLIGGGVGAYNAAKRLRRKAPDARVVLVSRDPLPPYHLPPLSKEVVRGEMTRDDLIYPVLEGVDQHLSTTVTALHANLSVAETDTGDRFSFRAALLATGSSPIILGLPGSMLPQVHYLRTAADAFGIEAQAVAGRRAVVVGAGFIGMELAASLQSRGVHVTVLEAGDRIWPRLDDVALSRFVAARCTAEGIDVRLGEIVVGIEGSTRVTGVRTEAGATVSCDFVCIGVGARPNVGLAVEAGIACEDGILVDAYMQTSAPGIYAVGDVARYPDAHAGRHLRAEHWGHAEYGGQIAAMNMLGEPTAFSHLPYVWSDVFDLHVESAGYVQDHDLMVVRGDDHERRLTHLYFRDNALVGYTAVNGDQSEFPAYRRLIRSRSALDQPSVLANPAVQARTLLT